MSNKGNPITDWTNITKAVFDDSTCFDDCYKATEVNAIPTTITTSKQDSLYDFKKGIKWDDTLFIILKDPKLWDSWILLRELLPSWCVRS